MLSLSNMSVRVTAQLKTMKAVLVSPLCH